jgi:hypothetical protein
MLTDAQKQGDLIAALQPDSFQIHGGFQSTTALFRTTTADLIPSSRFGWEVTVVLFSGLGGGDASQRYVAVSLGSSRSYSFFTTA